MERTEEKKNDLHKPPICFVIMPFTDPDGYEKGHFRKIYEQVFVPAIEEAGYTALRVDEEVESTMIHGKLLNQLVTAPMVLCDLSSKNPNVLYELGIRHAFDLPVVLVQETGQSHIFDIGGITTIDYRKNRLYDEVVEDQARIAKAIKQTASTKKNYSIMSLARLEPARLDSDEKITKEDRIEIALIEMNHKINRLGDQIERQSSPLAYFDDSILKFSNQDSVENELFVATRRAEDLKLKNESGSLRHYEIRKTIAQLQEAIDRAQKAGISKSSLLARAEASLIDLRTIDVVRKEFAPI